MEYIPIDTSKQLDYFVDFKYVNSFKFSFTHQRLGT